ncbi:MAG: hypothetical protein IV090_17645 [Candidatus Sericytochromatia bacterium]|nr:hypothetical protein [Candidatus Sericytochromatia bacterium]
MKFLSLSKSALKASLSLLLLTSCTPESLTAVNGLLAKMQAQKSDQRGVVDPNVKGRNEKPYAENTLQTDTRTEAELKGDLKEQSLLQVIAPNVKGQQDDNQNADNTLQTDTRTEAELKGEISFPSRVPSLMVQTNTENQNNFGMAEPPPEQSAGQGCLQALIRVRFGQFELNPSAQAKSWKGRLETSQGRFFQLNKIQFEAQDQLELSVDQRLISFQTQTQPHYDGFATLLQVPAGSPLPSLKLITELGVKTLTFKELQHLNAVKSVDSTGNRIQIQAELLPPQTGACGNTRPELPELRFPGENTEVNEGSAVPTPVETPQLQVSAEARAETVAEAQF